MFIVGSFLVSASFVALVIIMVLYVYGVQKLRINNTQGKIDDAISQLTNSPDFDKVVTIQNQLKVLPDLHNQKPAVNRMFGWLKTLVPDDVSLNSLKLDFSNNTVEVKGAGKDLKAINVFIDTLKNAQYKYTGLDQLAPAFNAVVLGGTGTDDTQTTYKITFNFNAPVFDSTVEGFILSVPNITSSRSETERPKALYENTNLEDIK